MIKAVLQICQVCQRSEGSENYFAGLFINRLLQQASVSTNLELCYRRLMFNIDTGEMC